MVCHNTYSFHTKRPWTWSLLLIPGYMCLLCLPCFLCVRNRLPCKFACSFNELVAVGTPVLKLGNRLLHLGNRLLHLGNRLLQLVARLLQSVTRVLQLGTRVLQSDSCFLHLDNDVCHVLMTAHEHTYRKIVFSWHCVCK